MRQPTAWTWLVSKEEWFSGRDRQPDWPFDLDGHSAYHRIQDIEAALKQPEK